MYSRKKLLVVQTNRIKVQTGIMRFDGQKLNEGFGTLSVSRISSLEEGLRPP